MKRFLIFAILGPLIGLMIMLGISWFLAGNFGYPGVRFWVYGLPLAYVLGLAPALVAGAANWLLASKLTFWLRVGATFCAGYIVTVLTGFVIFDTRYTSLPEVLAFGLVGAIPAAICSWLSGNQGRAT